MAQNLRMCVKMVGTAYAPTRDGHRGAGEDVSDKGTTCGCTTIDNAPNVNTPPCNDPMRRGIPTARCPKLRSPGSADRFLPHDPDAHAEQRVHPFFESSPSIVLKGSRSADRSSAGVAHRKIRRLGLHDMIQHPLQRKVAYSWSAQTQPSEGWESHQV